MVRTRKPNTAAMSATSSSKEDNAALRHYMSFVNCRELLAKSQRERDRIVRDALQSSDSPLPCPNRPRCDIAFSTLTDAQRHMPVCEWGESPEDNQLVQRFHHYKKHKSEWAKLSPAMQMEVVSQALQHSHGLLKCIANCETLFRSPDELVAHLNYCFNLKSSYSAYSGDIRQWRIANKTDQRKLIRAALKKQKVLGCLNADCSSTYSHPFALMYHLDRCGIKEEEKPWKCYRCGWIATVNDSKEHLRTCGRPAVDETPSMDNEENGDQSFDGGGHALRGRIRKRVVMDFEEESSVTRFKVKNRGKIASSLADDERFAYAKAVADGVRSFENGVEQTSCRCLQQLPENAEFWVPDKASSSSLSFLSKKSVPIRWEEQSESPPSSLDCFSHSSRDSCLTAYCGGPISSIAACPCEVASGMQCVAVAIFPNDETLIPVAGDEQVEHNFVQFWTFSRENARYEGSLWFLLKVATSAILDMAWCPLPDSSPSSFLGCLALATMSGHLPIYRYAFSLRSTFCARIRRDVFMQGGDERTTPVLITARPDILLARIDESPLTSISWSPFENARHIAAVSASGKVIVWNLDALDETHVMPDDDWRSPPSYTVWSGRKNLLAVAFRERRIRFYDIATGAMVAEETAQRTAGVRIAAGPRVFPGVFSFQSDLIALTDQAYFAVNYIDLNKDQVTVVQMGNRHRETLWSVAVCPVSGSLLSVGGDGRLAQCINGYSIPHRCANREMTFCAETTRLQLNVEKRDLDAVVCTHQLALQHLVLRISQQKSDPVVPCLTDLPLASLTCVAAATTPLGDAACTAFCGGQAGLLFVVPGTL